ncbi:MAG: hypothetical protein NZ898_14535 [Myxococcota bacterium]|nr:hypothetical protein [Myxococcota bacterium]
MARRFDLLLIAAAFLLGLVRASPGAAQRCPPSDMDVFEMFERAAHVAIVEPDARARGTFVVVRALKGDASRWATLPEPPSRRARGAASARASADGGGACAPRSLRPEITSRVLAFATQDGFGVNPAGLSTVPLGAFGIPAGAGRADPEAALVEALGIWTVRDPAQRIELLVGLATRGDRLGRDAIVHLGTRPETWTALRRRDALRLLVAIESWSRLPGALVGLRQHGLMRALVRTHLPEAVPLFVDLLTDSRIDDADRVTLLEDLGRLTDRPLGPEARGWDRARWTAWAAHVMRESPEQLLAAADAERGLSELPAYDLRVVAREIAEGPRRWRALETCERALRRGLDVALDGAAVHPRDSFLARGLDPGDPSVWERLAQACLHGAGLR